MKIPVGKTLEGAFVFGVGNILSVLGTVWFPTVAGTAVIAGAAALSLIAQHASFPDPKTDPQAFLLMLQHFSGLIGLASLVILIASAMIGVGLLRKALGLRQGPVFIYFSLGADVWRMLGALLLLYVIFVGILIVAAGIVAAIWGLAHSFVPVPGRYWLGGIATAVVGCAVIYAFVRVGYFVPAVVVAEHRIGIGRAWSLAGGNFWRIVAVTLVITVAVNIVMSAISSALIAPFAINFAGVQDPAEFFHRYLSFLSSFGAAIAFIALLHNVLLYGLFAGATASAYRAVTSASPEGLHTA